VAALEDQSLRRKGYKAFSWALGLRNGEGIKYEYNRDHGHSSSGKSRNVFEKRSYERGPAEMGGKSSRGLLHEGMTGPGELRSQKLVIDESASGDCPHLA